MLRKRRRGPGSVIRETLEAWGIKSHAGCGCTELASEMDQIGVDQLEQKIDEYTEKMYSSILKWRCEHKSVPQPPMYIVKKMIIWAIDTSREEAIA